MPQTKVAYKTCKKCKTTKPISEFYVKERRRTATRYFSRCKPCYYAWVYGRDKSMGHKWHGPKQKNGPARQALHQAVLRRKVRKPGQCQACGRPTPKEELDGHHHKGYHRPLDVQWLCEPCHRKAHPNKIPNKPIDT
jgi:hypothetical protein